MPVNALKLSGRVWRAAQTPTRAREQAEIALDWWRFERKYGALLRRVETPSNGPRALLISLSEWPYQLKLEGVLAKGLALGGYTPVFLTWPGGRWSSRYLGTYGFQRFVHLPQAAREDAEVSAAVEEALEGELSFGAVKRIQFRGAQVGIHALSSLSRVLNRGRVSFADPDVRSMLAEQLRSSMLGVYEAEQLLDAVDPELVIFVEKGYAFGSIYDVAVGRGLNVVQWVHAGLHSKDSLVLKRYTSDTRRFHPTSLSSDTWRWIRELPWTADRERELGEEFRIRYDSSEKHPDAGIQAGKRIKSPEEVRAQLGLRAGRKLGVIFSHVLWDANMFFGEDLFDDQETWLVETVRAACENDEIDWVIKPHPANLHKGETGLELNDRIAIEEHIGALPDHVKLLDADTDINTYSLFNMADYGVTIRGTVGLELPCFGIPVVTAGTGRYSGLGFTIDPPTADRYADTIRTLHQVPRLDEEATTLAKRHAWALFRLRPFQLTSVESHYASPDRLRHPLGYNVELRFSGVEAVRSAPDLRAFAEWASDRKLLDYLAPLDAG